ncbi:MAG: dicarboxylate/amino acid:cation symporter [Planctomycetota bacterium]
MKLPKLQLHTKILIGLLSGVVFGILANNFGFSDFVAQYIKPVGTIFIRLISMIVVPLVFSSLLVGTASLNDIRKLGRIGGKTIAYYLCTTAVAISIGLILAITFKPGTGLSKETQLQLTQSSQVQADAKIEDALKKPSITDIILNLVPTNPIKAATEGNMLQVIFSALIVGVALTLIDSQRARPVISFFEGVSDVMIQIVHMIMKIAPYGVFALISAVVGDLGLGILLTLFKYSLVVAGGLVLHMIVTYPLAIKIFSKLKIRTFFEGIQDAQLIAFSSSSSAATLPVTMECVEENLGVSNEVSSFVLPLGATINMDGTALYQGVAAVFIAQVYGMDLSFIQQLMVVLTATLASIGTAGAPGVGMITLAMVLSTIGVPLEGIALILGVDRILDMCRTIVNITGDASCAVIVASTENELSDKLNQPVVN